jgi:lipopolysaccharide/colanic/teichoic acid biosynthesis glycosyltransferase
MNANPGWKRIMDVVACLAALPLLGIFGLLVKVIQGASSPGPLLFTQERVGHLGRRFRIYKFRTMRTGTDSRVHRAHFRRLMASNIPMAKLDSRGDNRLFPGGWILRASGIDELPQILNVLKGDMSLVGPRPCIPYEFEEYTYAQKRRFNAKPGLTGLWQISGKNLTTFEEMIRLDCLYGQTLSPWLDLRIVLMTIPALIVQIRGARRAKAALARAPRIVESFRREPSKALQNTLT